MDDLATIPVVLKVTRILGGMVAVCLLLLISALLAENLRYYGLTADFFYRQLLPVFIPYFALLILLLLPFSRIRNPSVWTFLFIAIIVLSLVWLAPVAHRAISYPSFNVEKPPGEGVAPRILISRSYREFVSVGLIAVFLLTQILAIWFTRQRMYHSAR